MKKIWLSMLLVVCSSAYGQGKTDILAAAAGNIKAGTVIGFDFSATDGKGKKIYEERGTVSVWGDKFRMEIPDDLIVVSDGVVKWIYKPGEEELIIAENNTKEQDVLENPFSILEQTDRFYNVTVGTEVKIIGGKGVKKVTLIPREAENNYVRIDILIEKDKNIPVRIEFLSIDGSQYTASIRSFRPLTDKSPVLFRLDPEKYPDAVVTDLR